MNRGCRPPNGGAGQGFKTFNYSFQAFLFQKVKDPLFGMGKRQNTQNLKQKQKMKIKPVHRSQQQRILQAFKSEDEVYNEDIGTKTKEGKYGNLTDGSYEKTIYVKTWNGKTITAKINLKHTVESLKERLKERTNTPKEYQHLVSRGKVLTDKKTLIECYIYNGKKREKNPSHTLMLVGWRRRSSSQLHPKKKQCQRKSG